ncbi:catalase [Xanthomonas vasicola]|uniref:catalase n=1 Tax=Xanthomonas vasicola TaxID=56459 RepID=UPI0012D2A7EE
MENFRIHAAIGIARVGNSNEHVIAPESMTGAPLSGASDVTGGLPIRAGTESDRCAVPICAISTAHSNDMPPVSASLRIRTWPKNAGRGAAARKSSSARRSATTPSSISCGPCTWPKKKTTTFILPEAGRQRIASYSDGHLPPIRNPSIDKPHAPLTTDRDLSDDYATAVQARFSEYLINRNHFDDLERRWPDSAFWARRQARLDLAGVA